MVSPKYGTHGYYPISHFIKTGAPNLVNLYLDYNCPFSVKLFIKFHNEVIPQLESKHPGKFQFLFMHVIQPWHSNSIYQAEFALSIAKLIRDGKQDHKLFWKVSESLFDNIQKVYDNATSDLGRNAIYALLYDIVHQDIDLPFTKNEVLDNLVIPQVKDAKDYSNAGNAVTVDVKYFTRYHRTVGVHMTPTVSINGIENSSISSGTSPEDLIKIFESFL